MDEIAIKQEIIRKINLELKKKGEVDVSKLASIAYKSVMDTTKDSFNNLPSINNQESE